MSEYLQQLNIRHADESQPSVGGINMSYSNNTIKGGFDGMSKIQHLSIPLGLVLFPNLVKPICKHVHKNMEPEFVDDRLFEALFAKTMLRTKHNISHKKRPNHKKLSKKIHYK